MKFSIGQILSVTTGRLLCSMNDVYNILNFMTQDDLFTHQLLRANDEVKPYVFEQLPWTKEVDASHVNPSNWQAFLQEMTDKYGAEHELFPMHGEDHEMIGPIEELKRLRPDIEPIVINLDPPISPTGDINWKVE